MPRINSRAKGAAGERELCDWLAFNFNLVEKPVRNLEQTRAGGADILYPPFAFECKRVEKIDLLSWWSQVKRAVENPKDSAFGLEPVVAFRQNKEKWNFLISGRFIGIERGWVRLTENAFKLWVPKYLESFEAQNKLHNNLKLNSQGRFELEKPR